jgi:hypothetical protein
VKDWVRQVAGREITFADCLDANILTAIHDRALEELER